jgi:hypothetical protein
MLTKKVIINLFPSYLVECSMCLCLMVSSSKADITTTSFSQKMQVLVKPLGDRGFLFLLSPYQMVPPYGRYSFFNFYN